MIKPHGIDGLMFKHHNQESISWYDPLKPYTLLEYEWVRANCRLEGATVIDAGCHHGNYSVVFKPAFVYAVDYIPLFCGYAAENMTLNEMDFRVECVNLGANGVTTDRRVDIYKVDIEGGEYELFPVELAHYPSVHTWILELHPKYGSPDNIAGMFYHCGFELLKVDRDEMRVRPYVLGEKWPGHATLIARVKDGKKSQ